MKKYLLGLVLFLTLNYTSHAQSANPAKTKSADVIIYGGTSAAVVAAVQVRKMGKSVIIVSPDRHLGGLSSGGLGFSDTGNKEVIGGLSREFYQRIYDYYQSDDSWNWQKKSEYGNKGQGTVAMDGDKRTMWIFEPHIAEQVFEDFIADYSIEIYKDEWLDRDHGVQVIDGSIQSIQTLSGAEYTGKMFIDATYEGDLMASAGVSYTVGRESNERYGENWNGVQTGVLHHDHWYKKDISPYVVPGDPLSGVLPLISVEDPGQKGEGDHRIQAYCFRLCMTDLPENRLPFPKPENYDPSQYELMLRVFQSGWRETFTKFDPIPNKKTDTNNHGPFSSDNIGKNYDYPDASYARRREIIKQHEDYQKGMLYFMANDPRMPKDVQDEVKQWGLAKDEFTDNNHWPHQLYIREARRMQGEYVLTEHDVTLAYNTPKSIGMGSYTIDSHNVQRYIKPDGYVQNEGDLGVHLKGPYKIGLGTILPKENECKNLLVPVCVSASHTAFGSVRMEPVFMILGQSAATAAVLSMENKVSLHQLDYELLKSKLQEDGQVLNYKED
ncbi:hypothetical protein GCM10007049_01600 [Echinicola pacifica]|uniref:FAD dependent oxidoreductase n=1 Tax=Echinicola pacifica TaxID=346377 RepID=A0A918PL87_9BACT|nr:FAD-dependent oxidoreductase [Echinicola pacifica]GGZ13466.1 hypothetical protein GCM10007049_01600 [Echinicola pacifica]